MTRPRTGTRRHTHAHVGSAVALTLAALTGTAIPASAAPGPVELEVTNPSRARATWRPDDLGGRDGRNSPPARTSPAEARRVDRVPTPTPTWTDCAEAFSPGSECAFVELPLDYDEPRGPTTTVAVLRVPAADPSARIGTLFINPGGPGGSGVEAAAGAAQLLPAAVLARFDVVGFDPRGTNYSDRLECFTDPAQQADAEAVLYGGELFGAENEAAAVAAAQALGSACSTSGGSLARSMSTAQVARDMDVLRRMVGDPRLTYVGFSYGSYLGTVYANLFPDRVRALALDGVVDPSSWSGTGDHNAGRRAPWEATARNGEATERAVTEILARCTEAGADRCHLAGMGDPGQLYAELLTRLETAPPVLADPATGFSLTLSRGTVQALIKSLMYDHDAPESVDELLTITSILTQPPGMEGSDEAAAQAEAREAALAWFASADAEAAGAAAAVGERRAALGLAPARDNTLEALTAVLCTDGLHPRDAARWPQYAAATDATSGGFGRTWAWMDAPCATSTWRAHDEDAYLGPFTRRTASPVLIIGNYWDAASRFEGAEAASRLLPNSRLLASDSWGHTASGTSDCVDAALAAYLVSGVLPARGTVCTGDLQPFTTRIAGTQEATDAA